MKILVVKLRWAALALVALALAATGARAFAPGVGPKRPASSPMARATALVPDDAPRVGKIYFGSDDGLTAVDPRTGETSRLLIECKFRARISPDGRLIAFEWKDAIWVRELEKAEEPRKLLDLEGAKFGTPPVWSPDGTRLIVSLGNAKVEKDEPWRFKTVRINVDGTGREELNLPPEDGVQDWAPGDWLVTTSSRNAKIGWELYAMKPDGTQVRQITEGGNPFYTRTSPDGRRVLYADGTTEERRGIWVVGIDGQGRRKVLSVSGVSLWSACWSPDGKRIATLVFDDANPGPRKCRLVLQEVDGDGRTEFPLDDVKQSDMPDWR